MILEITVHDMGNKYIFLKKFIYLFIHLLLNLTFLFVIRLSYIPLIAPSTIDARIKYLSNVADSFLYIVSKMGITGSGETINTKLPGLINRVRKYTNLPLAVGFGVSNRDHFKLVGLHADGVVIGSKIVDVLKHAGM